MAQKLAKSLPKRATNAHLKERRKGSWLTGRQRKALRVKENEARAKANAAAGKTPRRHTRRRPRKDNTRQCTRCRKREIVAGSVCWCAAIGEVSRRVNSDGTVRWQINNTGAR